MYALPLPNLEKKPKAKPFILHPNQYIAQEKFDGIRLVTEISDNSDKLFVDKGITSWSRYGNKRALPEHIMEELSKFPNCIIDGELMAPGKRSYGTMDLENTPDLVYYIFDLLQVGNIDVTHHLYDTRRGFLENKFSQFVGNKSVLLAEETSVNTWDEVYALRDAVWARDGEGLILKNTESIYISGKRPKDTWIKIKKLQSDPFIVIGFEASRGQINNRGPYGITKLRDMEGNFTQVGTKNDAQCRLFEERGKIIPHPDIGRRLWCEYQERTPDKSYRHIRWDHWDSD